jgi:NAD(P)-dependent dehydrogenase (short-subunit alcohol dehydrogenase family)
MTYRPLGVDLSGRVAVVTGANSGMGKETARELARMGASVVLACRDAERGEDARRDIDASTGTRAASVIELDLSSLRSVREFAAAFTKRFAALDVLVNNAAASLSTRQVTADGFERHWATNVLGPHLLTTLLLPSLIASGRGRVVDVSTRAAGGLDLSDAQYERRRYRGVGAYRASKQAGRMLAWALAEQSADRPVTVNAVNPGYVYSALTRSVTGPLRALVALTRVAAQTPLDGADTAIWAAASPDLDGVTGRFFSRRREIRCPYRDPDAIAALRRLVERQLAAEPHPTPASTSTARR